MNLTDIQIKLVELRKKRDNLSVKLCDYRKKGKDTTVLSQEMEQTRNTIAELTNMQKDIKAGKIQPTSPVEQVKKQGRKQGRKKATVASKPVRKWKKSELESCHRTLDKYLEDNDWCAGYQFRSSDWMFIKSLETKIVDNGVALVFVIQYKTPNHRVERLVSRIYDPDTVGKVDNFINALETWVMLNSGDKDDNNIVFGDRFNKVQFAKQEFAKKGWVIYK